MRIGAAISTWSAAAIFTFSETSQAPLAGADILTRPFIIADALRSRSNRFGPVLFVGQRDRNGLGRKRLLFRILQLNEDFEITGARRRYGYIRHQILAAKVREESIF